MGRLVAGVSLFLLAAGLFAADTKPAALAAKEVADGWLLIFDGETTFGWKITGDAKVADGKLVLGGDKETTAVTTSEFCDGEIRLTFAMERGKKAPFEVGGAAGPGIPIGVNKVDLEGGAFNGVYEMTLQDNRLVRVKKSWGVIGEEMKSVMRVANAPTSHTPFRITVPAKTTVTIHELKFRPQALKSLFNGKDLKGWKEFADKKSKFAVNDKGELNVKDGPGDLRTEGEYDDFLLQFECISNGKALNSGIFFRCIPEQYQNGYEAQIQNGFKDGDRTKPADFGTGAIYRRVPARKVVSNDNEWFTMTVLARGNHIATWVNGYQTVDWTDDRPADDNPRKGSKTGKGHISIQGHDPTTDLSFRNIRIAEMPKAEKK